MASKRFNPAKLEKLNNPERVKELPIEFLAEKADLKKPEIIIDLGAGTGLFSKALSDFFPTAKVHAFDISDIMVNWMKENVAPHYANVLPQLMDDASIPMPDGKTDFLLMVNLHHEIDNPLNTINEAYRLLKKGASIAISDWRKEEMDKGPSVQIRVAPEEVKEQLEQAGFSKVQIFTEFKYNYLVVATK